MSIVEALQRGFKAVPAAQKTRGVWEVLGFVHRVRALQYACNMVAWACARCMGSMIMRSMIQAAHAHTSTGLQVRGL